jgi:NADH-quinone oxidoreductase subunit M
MVETDLVLMSLVVFTPAAFAAGLLLFPSRWHEAMRWWALFGAGAALVLSACLFIHPFYSMIDTHLDAAGTPGRGAGASLEARAERAAATADDPAPRVNSDDGLASRPWVSRFGIRYTLGVDGINMPLVLLTTLLVFAAVLASWKIDKAPKAYLALVLLLETGVLGAFLSIDLFLFYVFYEVMLVPMYFLIGLWGTGNRQYAALKFFLYTLAGSVLILVAMLALYFTDVRDFVSPLQRDLRAEEVRRAYPDLPVAEQEARAAVHTFDLLAFHKAGRAAGAHLRGETPAGVTHVEQPFFTKAGQYAIFLLLFVGFAIKLPVVPLHTWLPDAHVEAPTPVSMLLAGVLLKLGGYGLIRVAWPVCPWAAEQLAWTIGLFAVINLVYGALVAMGQTDFKKLLAYSSVSHMGYVLLGIAAWSAGAKAQFWAWGMTGAMFQMVAHGITSAALFFVVGVAYDRAHHRDLNRFRGLMEPMPIYGGLSALLLCAAMGLPGLCGFVGEVFVMLGSWSFSPVFAVGAALTTVLTAAYTLWTLQRVFFGTNPETKGYADVSLREALTLMPLAALAVALGVLPGPLLMNWMEPTVSTLVQSLAGR